MNCLDAIFERRSIRRYKPDPIDRSVIEEILQAGMAAPSSKNRQPWKWIVVTGEAKKAAIAAFERGIEREKQQPFLTESAAYVGGAEHTAAIMKQAPVVIFVMNTLGAELDRAITTEERVSEICNTQSIGAAVENMILAATAKGLGSLWICDTYFAQQELSDWLGAEGVLCAALALGYADEAPLARPRKKPEDVIEWRE